MKCDELTPVTREYADEYWADRFAIVYNADEVDAAIAELKAKLYEAEEARIEAGADAADYYQENRKLKRALYKACVNWMTNRQCAMRCFDLEERAKKFDKAIAKCRAKAEGFGG